MIGPRARSPWLSAIVLTALLTTATLGVTHAYAHGTRHGECHVCDTVWATPGAVRGPPLIPPPLASLARLMFCRLEPGSVPGLQPAARGPPTT